MAAPIETVAVPLLVEELQVERRRVETARVRVRVRTAARRVEVSEELVQERVEVTRVPIGRHVDAIPPVREEHGVTIVPVVDEVVVVERRLMLREEVHIRRTRVSEHHSESVMLREQQADVERDEF